MRIAAEYYQLGADQGRIFRKVIEGVAAFAALVIGLQFIFQGWGRTPEMFLPMSQVASPVLWGLLMSSLGLFRGAILVVNGWWPPTHMVRKWTSVAFILGVWAPLAACYSWRFVSDIMSGGVYTYPGIAFSVFTLGAELMVFYAHASFVYVVKRGRDG